MLRLAPPWRRRFAHSLPGPLEATFAGAEANVAVAVAQLGAPVRFVTTLPAPHPAADAAGRELTALGVDVSCIQFSPTGRLGVYYYEPGATARAAAVTYDRSDSAFALAGPDTYDWGRALAGAVRLHLSGITPAVSAPACAAAHAAVSAARRLGVPVSLDLNFRSALWRWSPAFAPTALAARELTRLAESADVLFAGPADGSLLLGDPAPTTLAETFSGLGRRFSRLRFIACSHRGEDAAGRSLWSGRLHETASGTTQVGPEFVIADLVDRLGIGDAFAGGLLRALGDPAGVTPSAALALATAAGALKHGIPGDYLRASFAEVQAALAGAGPNLVHR